MDASIAPDPVGAPPPASAEHDLRYRFRRSAAEREAEWVLGAEALERREPGGRTLAIPLAAVDEIRLTFDPTRFDRVRYRCGIRGRNALRESLVSTSYVSFGTFEDRGRGYAPFVREFVRRTARANPRCRFRAGARPLAYAVQHLFLLAILVLLAVLIAATAGVPPAGLVLVKLAIVAAYVPLSLRHARRNWPRRFDPASVPDDVLPPAGAARFRQR